MNYANYDDVINQLEGYGLDVSRFDVGKIIRCRVDGKRGLKGWYSIHETPFDNGALVLVGSYGIWSGNDNGALKIEIPADIKKTATKEDNALIRKRIAANKKRIEAETKAKIEKAARIALQKWRALKTTGESSYITKKQIRPSGIRFTADGAIAVPVRDHRGKMHGLQFILDKANPAHKDKIKRLEGDKRFWPTGLQITGNFHSIDLFNPVGINLIAEGLATGDTLNEATDLPTLVAYNANNVIAVVNLLIKHHPKAKLLICADDDYLCRCQHCKKKTLVEETKCKHCGESHGKHNTGITVAMKAALSSDQVQWTTPTFLDRQGKKHTDFNDLRVHESLPTVTHQINTAIAEKFPTAGHAAPERGTTNRGEGKAKTTKLSPIVTVDEATDRYSLVYGVKETMFDHEEHILVPKSCVMDLMPDHGWREWKTRPDRKVVRMKEVGFDPAETDPSIRCNMWGGWPTVPKEGCCNMLLTLLEYLCSEEDSPREVYDWCLNWLAYPIQNPGAKMKTALVFHGPTRVGKNLFFESIMAIYAEYGRVIGQSELEDKHNEWVSRKLFLIANEVIARKELFHQKNKLKALVTDEWIHVNPKHVAAYSEHNHINQVYMSNELEPVIPDPDDDRFMVIWTPSRHDKSFYKEILDEINNGGIESLHDYLLNRDLGDFHQGTPPLKTRARKNLIDLTKESPDRFCDIWVNGELEQACQACALSDLYITYQNWCRTEGERFSYAKNKFSARINLRTDTTVAKKHVIQSLGKTKTVIVVLPDSDPKPETDTWKQWLPEKINSFKTNWENNECA